MAKHGLRVLRKLAVAARETPEAASMAVRGGSGQQQQQQSSNGASGASASSPMANGLGYSNGPHSDGGVAAANGENEGGFSDMLAVSTPSSHLLHTPNGIIGDRCPAGVQLSVRLPAADLQLVVHVSLCRHTDHDEQHAHDQYAPRQQFGNEQSVAWSVQRADEPLRRSARRVGRISASSIAGKCSTRYAVQQHIRPTGEDALCAAETVVLLRPVHSGSRRHFRRRAHSGSSRRVSFAVDFGETYRSLGSPNTAASVDLEGVQNKEKARAHQQVDASAHQQGGAHESSPTMMNQKDLANYWSEYFSLQLDWIVSRSLA